MVDKLVELGFEPGMGVIQPVLPVAETKEVGKEKEAPICASTINLRSGGKGAIS